MWTNRPWSPALVLVLGMTLLSARARAVVGPAQTAAQPAPASAAARATNPPLLVLGPGDEVRMTVFGQPNMNETVYVSDDGTISVPLAGRVHIGGLSPSRAAQEVEAAFRKGQFLVNPHVTVTIVKSRSQRVAVLGQVHLPGIYPIESSTTLIELLARAGGETRNGANTVYILRAGPGGAVQRLAVNLRGLVQTGAAPQAAVITLRGGDQVYVPAAAVFYVTGQVHKPGRFRLRQGMTVLQAVARAGGVTNMGSMRRIVIKRKLPGGRYRLISARQTQAVLPNDVITVRERIF